MNKPTWTPQRIESAIAALLIDWHPQWLTRLEIQVLNSGLGSLPGKQIAAAIDRMNRRGDIAIIGDRITWNKPTKGGPQ